ncbi:MAG: PIN domain-containing protein [Rhodospirillaceae bacterium]|nr:PIN domain-containing protein [bacterium]MDE0201412.1 PIN domain-containing protein [Rhodospirillaceae bacterium]MDE0416586.1 PIN domain-containing protein [bacterium]
MILLDTSVVSETMRPAPDPGVMDWLNQQELESLWLSVITVMELRFGAALLAPSARRQIFENGIDETVDRVFRGRIKHLDEPAVRVFADRAATARRNGRRVGFADAAIAAIAVASGFHVATRDTAPFRDMGASVINPWS